MAANIHLTRISSMQNTDPHRHTHLTALCLGLPRWADTRKVKPIWILLKQETVSGSGISWAVCKSAHHSRQITMPVPTTRFFPGRMPFLPPNQQRQSTEGQSTEGLYWSTYTVVLNAQWKPWYIQHILQCSYQFALWVPMTMQPCQPLTRLITCFGTA